MCHYHSVRVTASGAIIHHPSNHHSRMKVPRSETNWEVELDPTRRLRTPKIRILPDGPRPTVSAEVAVRRHYDMLIKAHKGIWTPASRALFLKNPLYLDVAFRLITKPRDFLRLCLTHRAFLKDIPTSTIAERLCKIPAPLLSSLLTSRVGRIPARIRRAFRLNLEIFPRTSRIVLLNHNILPTTAYDHLVVARKKIGRAHV